MCGLVAVFPTPGYRVDRSVLEELTDSIAYRGPDGRGFATGDWFALGHRRLSVIDVAGSPQPLESADGRYVIAYNGEIYNYVELREELRQGGYSFQTSGDTEVVMAAYDRWGSACLDRFEGMFAFVLIDRERNAAIAARDQLGIKPLFLLRLPEGVVLASEIKPLLRLIVPGVRTDALYEQLTYRYVAGRRTIFEQIERLPAGHFLAFQADAPPRESQYHDVAASLTSTTPEDPNSNVTAQELAESIDRHTRSDVGYNLQLSGGLDSSYLVAHLAQKNHRLRTYSVSLDNSDSEKPYQDYVVDRFKTEHHDQQLDGRDFAAALDKATWHMDMPIIHGACVFLMLLCQHAKETSKVILTGEGADELFSGYSRYRFGLPVRLADRLQRTGFPPQLVPPVGKLKTMRRLLSVDLLERVATVGTANNATDALLIDGGGLPLLEAMRSRFPDLLRQLIAVDQTAYLQSLFERQDRMSMAASVESRVPYCTPRLFAMANRWRPGGRFPGGEPKGVFKKIAGNVFPHKFVYRPKVGFNLPYGAWLRDERNLGQYLDLLTDETFRSRGFFDSSAIARMVDQHRNGRDDHAVSLLRLIFFEIWCRRFIGTTQSKSCPLISQVT